MTPNSHQTLRLAFECVLFIIIIIIEWKLQSIIRSSGRQTEVLVLDK